MFLFVQVFDAIRDNCIHWWCRRNKKSVPGAQADDNMEYKKKAMLHLFTCVYDEDGYNVLQYAAKLAATGKSAMELLCLCQQSTMCMKSGKVRDKY